MFELLLQADKSLSEGLLDQAERTYWQLIELDPTNAIAMAGLAMISLERLDKRLARTFAERALGIDPESIVARRVLQALNEGATLPSEPAIPDAALRGAEKLEALSRRHTGQVDGDDGDASARPGKSSARRKPASPAAPRPPVAVEPVRGRSRPGEFAGPTSEPLRERRKAGRLAAAAAAAAAVAREPAHARHEPHHAMPPGRSPFEPRKVRPPQDPFAAAEMAAAVAAVDSMDDAFETESWAESTSEAPAEVAAEATAEVTTTAAGTAREATVEPVVTEVRAEAESASGDSMAEAEFEAGPVAAEAAPTTPIKRADARAAIEWPANDRLVSARAPKAVGGTKPGDLEALRRALLAATPPEAPELEETATLAEPRGESDATIGGAAEAPAAAQPAVEARHEVAATPAAQPEGVDWDLSEANAEREALREAVAIVMDQDAGLETAPEQTGTTGVSETAEPVVSAPAPAESHATEPPTTGPQTPPVEAPPDANAPAKASAVQDPAPRKKGLFRRIRG